MRTFEIIDFHTHPFIDRSNNICSHIDNCDMSARNTKVLMEKLGISKICGSVIGAGGVHYDSEWDKIRHNNDQALELKKLYGDFYIPGFHVNADYVRESCREIERMADLGVFLIGELVPYFDHWKEDYASSAFDTILDCAQRHNMVVSFHSMGEDAMDRMVEKHPDIVFAAAHPGEFNEFNRHMERMKKSENYYLDVSGYGIFRHGMLRHAIDLFGPERFLFGSDYPTCNPAMYLGGVVMDPLITESEMELILAGNAKRLLKL